MKTNVALIFGGETAEHEISMLSAKNIAKALDLSKFSLTLIGINKQGQWFHFNDESVFEHEAVPSNGKALDIRFQAGKGCFVFVETQKLLQIDAAFPIIHGTFGEDGCIQGLLKMMHIPFVGCDVMASAVGMDKEILKKLLRDAGILSAPFVTLTKNHPVAYEKVVEQLGSPFFIKPARAGSSVGVHKIKNKNDYAEKLADALRFDRKILAEKFIQGREIEISVMGDFESPKISLPGEVIVHHEFYSYEAKYLDENGASLQIPAKMNDALLKKVQEVARKTYETVNCEGLTRVDFFITANEEIYVNEINTVPGFTKISMYPKMWEAAGVAYTELISNLVLNSLHKYEEDKKIIKSYK